MTESEKNTLWRCSKGHEFVTVSMHAMASIAKRLPLYFGRDTPAFYCPACYRDMIEMFCGRFEKVGETDLPVGIIKEPKQCICPIEKLMITGCQCNKG